MKYSILLIIILVSNSIFSQDTIILINNQSILSKVIEVSEHSIYYKKHDNLNGPKYIVSTLNVSKIIYQNGSVDYFNDSLSLHYASNFLIKYNKLNEEYFNNKNAFALNVLYLPLAQLNFFYERKVADKFGLRVPVFMNFYNSIRILEENKRLVYDHKSGLELIYYPAFFSPIYLGISTIVGQRNFKASYKYLNTYGGLTKVTDNYIGINACGGLNLVLNKNFSIQFWGNLGFVQVVKKSIDNYNKDYKYYNTYFYRSQPTEPFFNIGFAPTIRF
jgi:hypothetical protein